VIQILLHSRAHAVFSAQNESERFIRADLLKHRLIHPKIEAIAGIGVEGMALSKPDMEIARLFAVRAGASATLKDIEMRSCFR
jgi:hypothetical protein